MNGLKAANRLHQFFIESLSRFFVKQAVIPSESFERCYFVRFPPETGRNYKSKKATLTTALMQIILVPVSTNTV